MNQWEFEINTELFYRNWLLVTIDLRKVGLRYTNRTLSRLAWRRWVGLRKDWRVSGYTVFHFHRAQNSGLFFGLPIKTKISSSPSVLKPGHQASWPSETARVPGAERGKQNRCWEGWKQKAILGRNLSYRAIPGNTQLPRGARRYIFAKFAVPARETQQRIVRNWNGLASHESQDISQLAGRDRNRDPRHWTI